MGRRFAVAAVALLAAGTAGAVAQLPTLAEHDAIAYSSTAPDDPIARLQQKIDSGEVRLEFDDRRGYLSSLLQQLDVPVSSQGLVFSKTSLQLDRIAPWSPRALYFNDDVYVGWVQGGPMIEIASIDPKLGTVFYTLPQERTAKPTFQRETQTCLVCHDSSSVTGGVPGLIVRSVLPDRYGYGMMPVGKSVTTDQSPLEERWGGWYVTGTHGDGHHMGNVIAPVLSHEVGNLKNWLQRNPLPPADNVTSLDGRFDTEPYLTPHSDIVSLMVIAHQAYVHNVITAVGYGVLKAQAEAQATEARIAIVAEPLVRALLMSKAATWTSPMKGTSGYAAEFAAVGKRDRQGRSLRDLDLERRLFRYPLSYLIYTESFDSLPVPAKQYVSRRIREVLTGRDTSKEFAHLTDADKQAVLEILADTKPGFGQAERDQVKGQR